VCRVHGGSARQVRAAAEQRIQEDLARAAAERHALPRDIDPGAALLEEVRRSAGIVEWLRGRVEELEPQSIVRGTRYIRRTETVEDTTTVTEAGPGLHLWWRLYQEERRHLVAVCKAALDAGVQDRMVRLAEQQGELLAEGLKWLLGELGHGGDEAATQKVVTMLRCLDGGRVPAAGDVA
jgi:hypothetical protein